MLTELHIVFKENILLGEDISTSNIIFVKLQLFQFSYALKLFSEIQIKILLCCVNTNAAGNMLRNTSKDLGNTFKLLLTVPVAQTQVLYCR